MVFSTTQSLAALVATAALLVPAQAQTYTECNPLKKTCPPNKALGSTIDIDMTSEPSDFITNGDTSYGTDGVELAVSSSNKGPYMQSNWYMMFGRVDVTMKAAPGGGVVSSFILQSDDLDEIDLEWVGTQGTTFQTNFFGKGFTGDFDRGHNYETVDATADYHTYSIDWNAERIQWIVDGETLRTVTPDDWPGEYPQSPMFVKFGPWAAGDPTNNPKGTVDWADGPIDFDAGPYPMYVKDITASDYSTGTEYKYTDQTGSWQSIEAVDGEVNGDATEGSPETSTPEGPSSTTSKATSKPTGMTTSTTSKETSSKSGEATPTTKDSTPSNGSATKTDTPTTAAAPDGGSESSAAGGSGSPAPTDASPTSDDTPSSASSSAPPENGAGKTVAGGLSLIGAIFGIAAAL